MGYNLTQFVNTDGGFVVTFMIILSTLMIAGFLLMSGNLTPHNGEENHGKCLHYIKHVNGDVECFTK